MRAPHLLATFAFVFAWACSSEEEDKLTGGAAAPPPPGEAPKPGDPAEPGKVDPATCGGKAFAGFEGENLVADRVVANVGVDRGRWKPYDALAAEYNRVLGNTPASLAAAADTFGKPEPRWYEEPAVGGVVVQTSYKIAFDGCLTYTATPADFAVAPTPTSASAKCAQMARAFWSRTASPDQIAACSDVALTGAAQEADPRRRWAYACASVLNAAGFATY
jgi:hypothetical protein